MTEPTAPKMHEASRSRSRAAKLGSVVTTGVMVALVALAGVVVVVPRVIGAVPLTVLTGSMGPEIQPGDLVVSRPVAADDLAQGDIVTFQPYSGDPVLVTHRVVSLTRNLDGDVVSLVTRGDANGTDDQPIVPEQVMGRVVYTVPLVGHLTNNGTWALRLGGIVGAGLIVYAVVILAWPNAKKDPTAGAAAEKEKTDAVVR